MGWCARLVSVRFLFGLAEVEFHTDLPPFSGFLALSAQPQDGRVPDVDPWCVPLKTTGDTSESARCFRPTSVASDVVGFREGS